jgi:hypothetical protein
MLEVKIIGGDFHGKIGFIMLTPTEGESNFLFRFGWRFLGQQAAEMSGSFCVTTRRMLGRLTAFTLENK